MVDTVTITAMWHILVLTCMCTQSLPQINLGAFITDLFHENFSSLLRINTLFYEHMKASYSEKIHD